MRWDDLPESTNVEDVRDSTGGGGPGLKLGVGGTLLALAASYFLGIDPRVILGLVSAVPTQTSVPAATTFSTRSDVLSNSMALASRFLTRNEIGLSAGALTWLGWNWPLE